MFDLQVVVWGVCVCVFVLCFVFILQVFNEHTISAEKWTDCRPEISTIYLHMSALLASVILASIIVGE